MKRIASVLPLVLLLVSLPLLGADSFEQLVKDYRAPRSGPTSQSPAFQFEFGNLKVDFSGGSIAPILAGSKPIGLFLKGAGEIAYRSVDPIEHPVLQTNLKHSTKLRADKDGAALLIRDTFTEALFLAAGPVKLPAVGEASGESLQSDWETHHGFFGRDLSAPAAHLFVIQNVDAPDRALLRAQFRGGKENLVYLYDDVVSRSESLVTLMELSRTQVGTLREFLFPAILSDQPIKRDRRDPLPARLGLTNLKYDLTAATNRDASVKTEQTFVPLVPQQVLRLDLYDVMYEENEKPPRRVNLRRVLDESGAVLPFHHFRDEVIVGLRSPAPAGTPFRLRFEIDGDFLIRPRNSSFWQLLGAWYPQPQLAGRHHQVHSTVRVEKPYVPFAPGKTLARRTEGNYNVVENQIDVPVKWAVVHAGSYVVKEETRNDITVRVATYAMGNVRAAKQLTELTFDAIRFYEPFLGPFPFREFNIIQVDSYGYGQAPPGTMFITHEAFTSMLDEMSRLFSEGINERFLHEIAHQYWGNVVAWPSEEEQWLSEAFAEYSAALALRSSQGEATYKRMLNTWRTNGRQASPVSPIPLVNRISMPHASAYERWAMRHWLLYQKGPYLLAVLHKELGDEAFLTFLKSYQASFRWKFGNTKHVVGLLKAITKKDYTPFFEDYFWGTKMPEMPR